MCQQQAKLTFLKFNELKIFILIIEINIAPGKFLFSKSTGLCFGKNYFIASGSVGLLLSKPLIFKNKLQNKGMMIEQNAIFLSDIDLSLNRIKTT